VQIIGISSVWGAKKGAGELVTKVLIMVGIEIVLFIMSANTMESFPAHISQNKAATIVNDAIRPERRKRVRATLRWPILFFRSHASEAAESIATQNLSGDGFYCRSHIAFVPGEALTCRLEVPSHEPSGTGQARLLECKVRVIRAEPASSDGLFGIACRFEDYRFVYTASQRNFMEPLRSIPISLDGENSSS
jgi:hypothetical protein